MSLTDDLRAEHHDLWEAMVTHPFVMELGEGTLPIAKFQRYFLQDYAFLKDLVSLTGLLIAKAPDFEAARRLTTFLSDVLGDEDTLFLSSFRRWSIPAERYKPSVASANTKAFGSYLVRLGYEGSWPEALTALVTTEWTYLDWATRLVKAGEKPSEPAYRQWIEIHANPEFTEFVTWLRGRLDSDGRTALRSRIVQVFCDCLSYEHAFWEMAYLGEGER